MIAQVLQVVTARLQERLPLTLATMPGTIPALAAAAVQTTRHLADDRLLADGPVVLVEQGAPIAGTLPMETGEHVVECEVTVECIADRQAWPLASDLSDDAWADVLRTLARGVLACLCRTPVWATDLEGVQVRRPSAWSISEPMQGDDAARTGVVVTLTIPAVDFYMIGEDAA